MKRIQKYNTLLKSLRQKITNRNIYFFWSGGDDSNLLLRIFLHEELNKDCDLNIIVIPFPQHCYAIDNIISCKEFFAIHKIKVEFLQTEAQIDKNINPANACLLCKSIRRSRFLDYYLPIQQSGDLIITSHNLSDLMSYYIELCTVQLDIKKRDSYRLRYLEVSNKFLASYQTENDTELFRPMLTFSQVEIRKFLSLPMCTNYPLEIILQKCFWANQRKRLLQDYFVKADIVSDFNEVYKLMSNDFGVPTTDEFRTLPFDTYLF